MHLRHNYVLISVLYFHRVFLRQRRISDVIILNVLCVDKTIMLGI